MNLKDRLRKKYQEKWHREHKKEVALFQKKISFKEKLWIKP